ncbi:hypothetical protein TNCV_1195891 [Trichonephila clavipes]|uniref:Uncharacterized protein n=1 Tax=Trichonephila clavipes TaxID=2585209 RepID=A0A8X6RZ30_TRICX|nr:hypothetical protein TNCV_1195891 [Trichonephila clavipes]
MVKIGADRHEKIPDVFLIAGKELGGRLDLREPFEAPSVREKTTVSPRSTEDSELWRLDFRELSEAPYSDKDTD